MWDITPLRGEKPKAGDGGTNPWDTGYGGCDTWDGGSNWYDSHWDESVGAWKYTPTNLNDTFERNASASATGDMVLETPCDEWLHDQEQLESMPLNDFTDLSPVGGVGECEGGEEEALLEADETIEPPLDTYATPPAQTAEQPLEEKPDGNLWGSDHKPQNTSAAKQAAKKRPAASPRDKALKDEQFGGNPDEAKPWVVETSSGSVGTKYEPPITWGPISKVAAVHFQQSVFGVQAIDFHSFSLKDLIAYTKKIDYVTLDCCKDAPAYVGATIGYIGWLGAEWHVDGLADVAYWLMEATHPKFSFVPL